VNLPLTAVGKIFKPALTMMEVESVVREEAERIGVTLDALKVEQDPRVGIVVRWHVAAGDAVAFGRALGVHVFRNQPLNKP